MEMANDLLLIIRHTDYAIKTDWYTFKNCRSEGSPYTGKDSAIEFVSYVFLEHNSRKKVNILFQLINFSL